MSNNFNLPFSNSFFNNRLHPSFKIIILILSFLFIFRLPIEFNNTSSFYKFIIFLIYILLFMIFILFFLFLDIFKKKIFLMQINSLKFLFLISLIVKCKLSDSSASDISPDSLMIPIYTWNKYTILVFFMFLFFYNFTKKKIPFKTIYFIFLIFLFFILPSLLLKHIRNIIFFDSRNINSYVFTKDDLLKSFLISLRLLLIIMIFFIFTKIVSFVEIKYGLEILLNPLKKIKFPVEIFTLMISLMFMSVPFLLQETNKILRAQTARGMNLQNKNIFKKINHILALLVPIFVLVFKRSLVLANAMEVRGYILGAPRTQMVFYKIKKIDFLILGIFIVCLILSFIFIN